MKILFVLFTFLAFTTFKILYLNSIEDQPEIIVPTIEIPEFHPIDLSGGCGGFTDCIEYVGAVIYNLALGIIFLIMFIINLLIYVFKLFTLIISVQFTGIDGAPWWVNLVMSFPFLAAVALILYKMVRRGSSAS